MLQQHGMKQHSDAVMGPPQLPQRHVSRAKRMLICNQNASHSTFETSLSDSRAPSISPQPTFENVCL
jgi:hypothetical protein